MSVLVTTIYGRWRGITVLKSVLKAAVLSKTLMPPVKNIKSPCLAADAPTVGLAGGARSPVHLSTVTS